MFELFIAARYLRAKRRQAVIGVITAISIVGVTAGVASLIIALAINNGFRQDLQSRLLGSMAHIQLMRVAGDGIRDWQSLVGRLEREPGVVADAPAIYEQVLISRGARAKGAVLKGVIPDYERRVSEMLQTVHWGSAESLDAEIPVSGQSKIQNPKSEIGSSDSPAAAHERINGMPPIILGKDMADELGATVGSDVLVTSPQGELTPFGLVPKYVRFRVAGIFQSGFYDYDTAWAYTRLSDAQRLFGLGDVISVIEFKIGDIYQAPAISGTIEQAAGAGYQTTNWMEQNRALFRALRLERVVTFITIGLIVFVAALNILISLIMMVMEKTKDIAVLMSLGARKRQVRRIFIAQGLMTSLVGTLLGWCLGYALAWGLGHYHWISLSPEVYSIDYVPSAPRLVDTLVVALVAIGVSFLATIYPSWTAVRVLPADALRYE
ncbi:MAG: FtsX-like permease family protein [Terriglobales bacterium]|jgi:lipoprotein-releasing system permease protein